MSEHNIVVEGGTSVRLPTAGKYCDRDIIVTAEGGGGGIDKIVVTGNCQYRFAHNGWNDLMDKCVTEDITDCSYMFQATNNVEEIPFEINCDSNANTSLNYCFRECHKLKSIPKINNCKPSAFANMFYGCLRLRYLPEDFLSWFDWSYFETYQYANCSNIFYMCYSLRSIPMNFFANSHPKSTYGSSIYTGGFYTCHSLDELIDLPVPYTQATWTSNAFSIMVTDCSRLKNLTFALNNGVPYLVSWKSQTIDLSSCTGYCRYPSSKSFILYYNSGITADKEVTDDATYQALKDDPDWFTTNIAYSRYNHDSAVATINSLPDTSAYLATAGGTNTIKFKGASGSATDGGAINTLTEAEIAVATAKGWTVTLV